MTAFNLADARRQFRWMTGEHIAVKGFYRIPILSADDAMMDDCLAKGLSAEEAADVVIANWKATGRTIIH
jgi:hypothetical protein